MTLVKTTAKSALHRLPEEVARRLDTEWFIAKETINALLFYVVRVFTIVLYEFS